MNNQIWVLTNPLKTKKESSIFAGAGATAIDLFPTVEKGIAEGKIDIPTSTKQEETGSFADGQPVREVTFSTPFLTPPFITITPYKSSTGANSLTCTLATITTTGFTYGFESGGNAVAWPPGDFTQNYGAHWKAVEI